LEETHTLLCGEASIFVCLHVLVSSGRIEAYRHALCDLHVEQTAPHELSLV